MKLLLIAIAVLTSTLGAVTIPVTQKVFTGKSGKPVTASVSVSTDSCRLVHDGTKVIAQFHSAGVTASKNTVFAASTDAECTAEIARLKLTPLAPAASLHPAPPAHPARTRPAKPSAPAQAGAKN